MARSRATDVSVPEAADGVDRAPATSVRDAVAGVAASASAGSGASSGASAPIESLDRAFLRIRRAMVKPVTTLVPLPSLGRTCDLAKVLACETVSVLTAGTTEAEGAVATGADPGPTSRSANAPPTVAPPTVAPPTVKDVAAAMELDHSTTSRLLGEAEAEGLLIRGSDPADRRRTTVSLTDLGRALVADATAIRRWTLAETFRDWDDRDVAQLASLMERLATTIAERGEDVKAAAFDHFGAAMQSHQA